MEKRIRFHGIESVRGFIALASEFPEKLEIQTEDTVVDAKSILGLFSLDLSKSARLKIAASPRRSEAICRALAAYLLD